MTSKWFLFFIKVSINCQICKDSPIFILVSDCCLRHFKKIYHLWFPYSPRKCISIWNFSDGYHSFITVATIESRDKKYHIPPP